MKLRKIIILLATIIGLNIVVFNNLNQMTDFLRGNAGYIWLFFVELVAVAVYVLYNNRVLFKKR
jgi:hypothetical protein